MPRRQVTLRAVVALTLAAAACSGEASPTPTPPSSPAPTSTGTSPTEAPRPATVEVAAEQVGEKIWQPASMAFTPDGRLLVGQRISRKIEWLDLETGERTLMFQIPKILVEEGTSEGLLGLAVHPDYADEPYVYAFATRTVAGEARSQILRIALDGDLGVRVFVVFDPGIAVSPRHNGGPLLFGPDGALYTMVGEHDLPTTVQDPGDPNGKIHRLDDDGKPAPGNPRRSSTVYASGLRNSFGLAFDPFARGSLWAADNGPECNDEVNRIVAEGNYGWGPNAACGEMPFDIDRTNVDGARPRLPAWNTEGSIGITGLAFCDGCGLGRRLEGDLLAGDFNTGQIHQLIVSQDRERIVRERVVYTHPEPVIAMVAGPDGTIYFTDLNNLHRLVAA